MTKSLSTFVLITVVLLVSASFASATSGAWYDDPTSTPAKKAAENPKKPSQAKNPAATEKVKTDDRMSTRGLGPPPKDADKDKDKEKNAKPDAKPDNATPK